MVDLVMIDRHVIDPPIIRHCWRCGQSLTIRSRLTTVMMCSPCIRHFGDIEISDRQALKNANDEGRAEIFKRLESARNAPQLRPIPNAPPEYQMATASAPVGKWARGTGNVAVLAGKPGRGKTWEAWGAIRITGGQMIDAGDLGGPRGPEMADAAILVRGLLVIDDLGAKLTPGGISEALRVVRRRIEEHRRTMVTTNLSGADIAALEPRLESRLAGGWAHCVDGPDRRRGAQA